MECVSRAGGEIMERSGALWCSIKLGEKRERVRRERGRGRERE